MDLGDAIARCSIVQKKYNIRSKHITLAYANIVKG
jgi:hypothetical protein